MSKSNSLFFLFILFIWVLCWRLPGFTQVVTTWDESLYFMIARDWLHNGVLPYTGLFDHKPIGIYLIFRSAIALFGDNIFAIRAATVVFVFLTCWGVYRLARRWLGETAGCTTAMIYPVLMLGMDGETSNTELFFPAFTIWGLVFLQHYFDCLPRINRAALFISGTLFGCAIATKYLVVFEAVYLVGLGLIMVLAQHRVKVSTLAGHLLLISVAACLPTLAAFLYYVLHNQTDAFIYGNFIANSKHLARDPLPVILADLLASTKSWARWSAPAFLVFTLSCITRPLSKKDLGIIFFLLGWLLATLCEAWVTLKFYPHYYNLTFVPLAILTGWSIPRLTPLANWRVLAIGLFLTLSWGYKTIKSYYAPWINEYINN
ncbi:MAG TPA: glycosyltransferase family 39 protein, partial [Pseudomonadales bacterium]|nr:glycosyltransferase family 39 protein [Pseudomonadales bacterium]